MKMSAQVKRCGLNGSEQEATLV